MSSKEFASSTDNFDGGNAACKPLIKIMDAVSLQVRETQ
jgi:hypothetical protein